MGGKLYRQGLIKMNEFVTLCGRDRIPVIWFQDTSGIDVGDHRGKSRAPGSGSESLIYSIQQTDVPMMLVVLQERNRCGPLCHGWAHSQPAQRLYPGHTRQQKFTSCTARLRPSASYSRRLVKEQDAGRPLEPVIEAMNKLAQEYHDNSRPIYCAQHGLVDEVVQMDAIRKYLVAFAGSAYQNPRSICPQHQMLLPRSIKG